MQIAPIYLTKHFMATCRDLEIPLHARRQIRQTLRFFPEKFSKLIYPTLSVHSRLPEAGIYELDIELRGIYGHPFLIRVHFFYAGKFIPITGMSLDRLDHQTSPLSLSPDDMNTAEEIALAFATVN